MSGLGRRTHYRKHLTDAVLNDFHVPDVSKGDRLARVIGTRGSNQFDVVVAPILFQNNEKLNEQEVDLNLGASNFDETPQLAILPTKYRKLVWLKRNDFVIVRGVDEIEKPVEKKEKSNKGDCSGGIRFMILHILYKDQIKYLHDLKLWPLHPFFNEKKNCDLVQKEGIINIVENDHTREKNEEENCDGINYTQNDYDDDFFVNTNRISRMTINESDSESSEDSLSGEDQCFFSESS